MLKMAEFRDAMRRERASSTRKERGGFGYARQESRRVDDDRQEIPR